MASTGNMAQTQRPSTAEDPEASPTQTAEDPKANTTQTAKEPEADQIIDLPERLRYALKHCSSSTILLNKLYFFVNKLNIDWSCLCSLKPTIFSRIDGESSRL